MDLMEELKSFDNVISAIDFLYLNLKERENSISFDLNRLRLIGIEACDRDSNTYLWHINALIHASNDLEHLILGLKIMFQRYLKSTKMNKIDNITIDDSIDTSMENGNRIGKIIKVSTMADKMDSNDHGHAHGHSHSHGHGHHHETEDENYFVQLKSRSLSRSPNKSAKQWKHVNNNNTINNNNNNNNDENNNNNNNNIIIKHCIVEPSYDATKIMENMFSNNSKTSKMGMGGSGDRQTIKQANEQLNEIRKNETNFLSVGSPSAVKNGTTAANGASAVNTISGVNGASGASAASSSGSLKENNDKNSVDYIAQLLLSPDINRKKNVSLNIDDKSTKGLSSPNARRMKRIKRIRQQQRVYSHGHGYQREYEHNYQHSCPQNLTQINEINMLNGNNINDNNNNNNKIAKLNNDTNVGKARQLSPFEIGKFVRQVDQLQN